MFFSSRISGSVPPSKPISGSVYRFLVKCIDGSEVASPEFKVSEKRNSLATYILSETTWVYLCR